MPLSFYVHHDLERPDAGQVDERPQVGRVAGQQVALGAGAGRAAAWAGTPVMAATISCTSRSPVSAPTGRAFCPPGRA